MNLVGKIFVSLIAIMSIVFFSLTLVLYASHKNWKEESAKKDEQIQAVTKEKSQLQTVKSDLEKRIADEQAAYLKAIAAMETRSKELETQNADLVTERNTLAEESQKRMDIINTYNAMINEYRVSIETMTRDLASAQKNRADYLQTLATTVNQMHELASIRGDLEAKNKELTDDFDKAMTVLNMKGLKPIPELYDTVLPYKVNGVIEAVQEGPKGLLMISLGSDNGLHPLHTLEAYRGDSYLGRIEVVTVEPNRAVCRILPEYRQGTIKEGDSVTSQFE